ncbi:MAG: putative alternative 3-dehydroquinate synthase [Planctomycetaceae bacterium]|nr:putative alternative 3-dehydroquinate synthase [Planctomycetaceae bacterium]
MNASRIALVFVFVALVAADPVPETPKIEIDVSGRIGGLGLRMAEAEPLVRSIHLVAQLDEKGAGKGTLVLDITPYAVNEFGLPEQSTATPVPVKLECNLKLIKRKKLMIEGQVGPPPVEAEEEWHLYSIKGPKISSRLHLAVKKGNWSAANFMVSSPDGTGRFAVLVEAPAPLPLLPCHPGCFPAGTLIQIPGGTKAVEILRAGDQVITFAMDGTQSVGKVAAVFITKNRLLEVQTEDATLVTTETQPLSLAAGGLRAAGELQAGDKVQTCEADKLRAVDVKSIKVTGRTEKVFNLVLGEPVLFVANGFLARSKPPAPPILEPVP